MNLREFELIGLGSGIFFSSHHRALLGLVREHSNLPSRAFLFSTAGLPWLRWVWHRALHGLVENKGIEIVGEVCYPGWDTFGPLRWIGGIQRGHPSSRDLQHAREFATRMVAKSVSIGQRT